MIRKGDKFLCIHQCHYKDNGDVIFKEGKVYVSEDYGCIVDEEGLKGHKFSDAFWQLYLVKVNDTTLSPISNFLNMRRLVKKHGYAYNSKTKEFIKLKLI